MLAWNDLLDLNPALLPAGSTRLHTAASSGNLGACRALLDGHSGDLELQDHRNWTPISLALHNGRLEVARLLLQRGASTEAFFCRNVTVRQVLESHKFIRFAHELVADRVGIDGFVPSLVYHAAAYDGAADVLDNCVSLYSVQVDHADLLGRTALHEAVVNNHSECVNVLLRLGCKLDVYDNAKLSPFHYACRSGNEPVVRKLLEQYTTEEINIVLSRAGFCGRTPLHFSLEYQHFDVVSILLRHSSSRHLEALDNCYVAPHHLIQQAFNNPKINLSIDYFLEHLHLFHDDFKTAILHHAIHERNEDAVRCLIAGDVDIEHFDSSLSHNSLLLACRLGNEGIVQLLVDKDANVSVRDSTLQTPLHIAARLGFSEVVQLLLQHPRSGDSFNAVDMNKYTAFDYAIVNKHVRIVNLFVDHYSSLPVPCPVPYKKQTLNLLAEHTSQNVLHMAESFLGQSVLEVLKSQETGAPRADNVPDVTCYPQTSAVPPDDKAACSRRALRRAQNLPKNALSKYYLCFRCLKLEKVPNSHSCRPNEIINSNLVEVDCCGTPNEDILGRNQKILLFYEGHLSTSTLQQEGSSVSDQPFKQRTARKARRFKAVWNRLYTSNSASSSWSWARNYNYYVLHTAAYAGNTPFLEWVFALAGYPAEVKAMLESENGACRSLIEALVWKGIENSVSSFFSSDEFATLVEGAKDKLVTEPEKESVAPVIRRTYSMRVHKEFNTSMERTLEIIKKKKEGRKMRCTDSDYTLLTHILYHNQLLADEDAEVIMDMLISRSTIAGARTLPCKCRCTWFSRAINLRFIVAFVLKCHSQGVRNKLLKDIIVTVCRHEYFHCSEPSKQTSLSLSLSASQQRDWWGVLQAMARHQAEDLLAAVCMWGSAGQATVLLASSSAEELSTSVLSALTPLQWVVFRRQPELLSALLAHPCNRVLSAEVLIRLLVICCSSQSSYCRKCPPDDIFVGGRSNRRLVKLEPFKSLNGNFEHRRNEVLDILLQRLRELSHDNDLSEPLIAACSLRWWEAARLLFEAGADPCASTLCGRMDILRYMCLEVLRSGDNALFVSMFHSAVERMAQLSDEEKCKFRQAVVDHLPYIMAAGLGSEVEFALSAVPGIHNALWQGPLPMAARLKQLSTLHDFHLPSMPMPEDVTIEHALLMAKFGFSDHLRSAMASTDHEVPAGIPFSDLIHWAAYSGDYDALMVVHSCLEANHFKLVKECQNCKAPHSVSTPWNDGESVFWAVALHSAISSNQESLVLRVIDRIVSSLSRKTSLTKITRRDLSPLHWVCYWGMSEVLATTEGLDMEVFTDSGRILTPLECAVGNAKIACIAPFISKADDVSVKLVDYFYDLCNKEVDDDLYNEEVDVDHDRFHLDEMTPIRCCIPSARMSVIVPHQLAALVHLLTLGWFGRIMLNNARNPAVSDSPILSSHLYDDRVRTRGYIQSQQPFLRSSLQCLLTALVDGSHRVVSAMLSRQGRPEVSEHLISLLTKDSLPLMQIAARSTSVETVTALLDHLPTASTRKHVVNVCGNRHKNSALLVAARSGSTACVRKLISGGANLKLRNAHAENVIHCAVLSKCLGTLSALLEQKTTHILIFNKDAHDETPVSLAVQNGLFEMVEVMRACMPAKRWNEEFGRSVNDSFCGWFQYLMRQHDKGWTNFGFQSLSIVNFNFSLVDCDPKPGKIAHMATMCNYPHILQALVCTCGELVVPIICRIGENYNDTLAEVALLNKSLFLPHIDELKLIESIKSGHETASVALLKEKIKDNPLFLTDSSNQDVLIDKVFIQACKSGSQLLIQCLMDFGILHNCSKEKLNSWLKMLLVKSHINQAASFLLKTDLRPDLDGSRSYLPPLLLSIFDPEFDISSHFDRSGPQMFKPSRESNVFNLPVAWLRYSWTPELLQIVKKNPSLPKENNSLTNSPSFSLAIERGSSEVDVSIDWKAFNSVAKSIVENCSRLANCPLLSECIVFSDLVMPEILRLCEMASKGASFSSFSVTVAMDHNSQPSITKASGYCITLLYSPSQGTFTFPDIPVDPLPMTDVFLPPPKLDVMEIVTNLAAMSIYPLSLPQRESVSIEASELVDVWNDNPQHQQILQSSLVSLFDQIESVFCTVMHSKFMMFFQRPQPGRVDRENFAQHKVLYSSLVSVVRPVLRSIGQVHLSILVSGTTPDAICSLEGDCLEMTLTCCWSEEGCCIIGNDWLLQLPTTDTLLGSLRTCLLQTRAQHLVNRLVRKLCTSLKCSTVDNSSLSIVLPNDKMLDLCEEPNTQAAMLNWLVLGKSGLLNFLNLVQILGKNTSLFSTIRDYLYQGIRIEIHVSRSPVLTTDSGWLTLILSMDRNESDIASLYTSLCSFGHLTRGRKKSHSTVSSERSFVFPSQCRLTEDSRALLYYPTLGSNALSVQLCDYAGSALEKDSENLDCFEVTVRRYGKEVHSCVWTSAMNLVSVQNKNLTVCKQDHHSFGVTWTTKKGRSHAGMYCLTIKVNGQHIKQSPVSVLVGTTFAVKAALALVDDASKSALPSKHLNHNKDVKPWFLPQDHKGTTVSEAGRPFVFHLQSNSNNSNNNNNSNSSSNNNNNSSSSSSLAGSQVCCACGGVRPVVDVPPRIRKSETGIIVRVPVSYSRQSSVAEPPGSSGSGPPTPVHHISACSRQRGLRSWCSYQAGPVQVFMRPKTAGAVCCDAQLARFRKSARVHCLQVEEGEYRLSVMQSWCGMFQLLASCALCHSVLTVCTTKGLEVERTQQVLCTALPGVLDPCRTHFATSREMLANMKQKMSNSKEIVVLAKVKAGSEVSYYLKFFDIYGNRITTTNPPDLPVKLGNTLCTIKSCGHGMFEGTTTLCKSARLHVTIGDSRLRGVVDVFPSDVDRSKSVLHSRSPYHITASTPWSCVIELYDCHNNPWLDLRDSLKGCAQVKTPHSDVLHVVPISPTVATLPAHGQYRITVVCAIAGNCQLDVKIGNESVLLDPPQFNVVVGTKGKVSALRQHLKKKWTIGSTPTMTIQRDNLLDSAMSLLSDQMLHKTIRVRFGEEVGIDAGGLGREFFELLGEALVNPIYGLFEEIGGKFRPNPSSSVNPSHLHYFFFTGKILAKAIAEGHRLTIHFTPGVYKYLCCQECTMDDLRGEDPQLHSGLQEVMKCTENDDIRALGLTFMTQINRFGSLIVEELEPGGHDREVTLENRGLYVQKILQFHIQESARQQLQRMKDGFNLLIPPHLLDDFTPVELDLLLSGMPVVDIDELQRRVEYWGCSRDHPVIQWLWEVLSSYSEEMRGKFLSFCTGSSRLPATFMHWKMLISVPVMNSSSLPTAATCSNHLNLPHYKSKEELEEKLSTAILFGAQSFHLH